MNALEKALYATAKKVDNLSKDQVDDIITDNWQCLKCGHTERHSSICDSCGQKRENNI